MARKQYDEYGQEVQVRSNPATRSGAETRDDVEPRTVRRGNNERVLDRSGRKPQRPPAHLVDNGVPPNTEIRTREVPEGQRFSASPTVGTQYRTTDGSPLQPRRSGPNHQVRFTRGAGEGTVPTPSSNARALRGDPQLPAVEDNEERPQDRAEIERQRGEADEINARINQAKSSTGTQVGTAISATNDAQARANRLDEAAWKVILGDPKAADDLTPVTTTVENARETLPQQSAQERQTRRLLAAAQGSPLPYFPNVSAADRIFDRALMQIERDVERTDLAKNIAAAFDQGMMNAEQLEKWESQLTSQELQNLKGSVVAKQQQTNKELDRTFDATMATAMRTGKLVTDAMSGPDFGTLGRVLPMLGGSN